MKYPAEIATLVIRVKRTGSDNFAVCGKHKASSTNSVEWAVRACALKSAESLVEKGIIAPIKESQMEFVDGGTFWHVHLGQILERRAA